MWNKRLIVIVTLGLLGVASTAFAYTLKKEKGGGACEEDGSTCVVYCDNGERAGAMNWNGSVWTDGVRSDEDRHVVARAIVAANGSACE